MLLHPDPISLSGWHWRRVGGNIGALRVSRVGRPKGNSVKIELVSRLPADTPVVVVAAHEGRRLAPSAAALDRELSGHIRKAMAGGRFSGAAGQSLDLLVPPNFSGHRVILVGLGKPGSLTTLGAQDVGGRIETLLAGMGEGEAAVALDLAGDLPAHIAFGALLAGQQFMKLRTRPQPNDPKPVRRLSIVAKGANSKRLLDRFDGLAAAVGTARTLVNEPANLLGPEDFVRRARALSKLGVKVEVLDEPKLRKLGMGALLAVGSGSVRRPCVLVLRWKGKGAKKGRGPIAFVGKGVVFDAGGLDIKKADGMEAMKADMAGAAAVVGVIQALAHARRPSRRSASARWWRICPPTRPIGRATF